MFTPDGIIALTTDFQADSFYVAEMKVAAYMIAREAKLVDVTHSIAPQNVAQASWVLLRAVEAFPPGTVHVVVVDPGVGTRRKILAAVIHGQVIIGPDNGLFDVVATRYPVEDIFEITNQAYFGERWSSTFHGRDIMVPAAAHLVRGVPLESLGNRVDVTLVTQENAASILAAVQEKEIQGRFVYADSFGNAVTNVFADDIPEDWEAGAIQIEVGGQHISGLVTTYGERNPGELVALFGSSGQLEVSIVQGDAAQKYGFRAGMPIKIRYDFT
ncbi:S-adenosyl-l-methionine hydroxide adenosyltransferase family protein [Blastopirellula marina]|uniref:Adenosyl-chloride synthase n=1 Tax=Blastopirellula marina TaxID=124 RepID=A0A2S8F7V4_9BACT|nr:SAM-dependent chlorinase/fluorinase [Blastopirellula marina]PQO28233.1 hypothetical protein C5Y98_25380 [Blastopirellula marina]PTL41773.1 hypothetical protein C5Y97_25395 [Blastopirellula marina]